MTRGASEDAPTSASEWAIRLNTGDLTVHERQTFEYWLDGDNERRREIDEARAVLRVSGALRDSPIARAHLHQSLRAIDAETPGRLSSFFAKFLG